MNATAQRERPVWTWTCRLCPVSGEARTRDRAASLYYQHYFVHHEPTTEVESA